jgi:hypothetical protein
MLTATMEAAIPAPPADLMTQVGQALQEALAALLTGQATPRRAAIMAEQKLGR